MTYYTFIPFCLLLINVFSITYVYTINKKSPNNRAFILFASIIGLWLIFDIFRFSPLIEIAIIPILKIGSCIWLSFSFFYVNFMYTILNKKRDFIYYLILAIAIFSILLSFFTNLVIGSYKVYPWGIQSIGGKLYLLVCFFAMLLPILYCFYLIIKQLRLSKKKIVQKQYLAHIIGAIVCIILGFFNAIVITDIMGGEKYPKIPSLFAVIYSLFVLYSVFKYKFLSNWEEELVAKLFAHVNDSILITDSEYNIRIANPAAIKLLKLNQKFFQQSIFDYISDYNINDIYLSKIFHITDEEKNLDKYISLTNSPIEELPSDFEGHIILIQDITEKIQAEEERKKIQRELFQSAKLASVGELAAGVAHEINNPMTIIKAYVEQIKEEFTKDKLDKVTIKDYFMRVEKAIDRTVKIIKQLKSYARVSDHELKEYSLNDIIENSLLLTEKQLFVRNIKINKNYKDTKPLKIFCDENEIEQVLVNLFLNAKDALESAPKKELTIYTDTKQDEIIVYIEDTGGGISEKNIDKIFDPFFTTKEVGKGSGLGLSISHEIMKAHCGNLKVENTEHGAKFIISFPVVNID